MISLAAQIWICYSTHANTHVTQFQGSHSASLSQKATPGLRTTQDVHTSHYLSKTSSYWESNTKMDPSTNSTCTATAEQLLIRAHRKLQFGNRTASRHITTLKTAPVSSHSQNKLTPPPRQTPGHFFVIIYPQQKTRHLIR